MHACYQEILDAMGAPKWWSEGGVPRYIDFTPAEADNIYATQVMLVRIHCQGCGHPFMVCCSSDRQDTLLPEREDLETYVRATALSETYVDIGDGRARRRDFGYGDPPNINCCSAGPTMNSVPDQILEFWREKESKKVWGDMWERVPDLEVNVTPSWWTEMPGIDEEAGARILDGAGIDPEMLLAELDTESAGDT